MKHCDPNEHAYAATKGGGQHCPKCGHHLCPEGTCDLALDPHPVSISPPTYNAICRRCGGKTTWPPAHVLAGQPPLEHHTTEDYARHAARFGHAPPKRGAIEVPVPGCTKCGAPATRYHPETKKVVCDKTACGAS